MAGLAGQGAGAGGRTGRPRQRHRSGEEEGPYSRRRKGEPGDVSAAAQPAGYRDAPAAGRYAGVEAGAGLRPHAVPRLDEGRIPAPDAVLGGSAVARCKLKMGEAQRTRTPTAIAEPRGASWGGL